ncbi:hypothetical protein GCM10027048_28920 [Hymenobacter coalescens]
MRNPFKELVVFAPSDNRLSTNQATAGIFVAALGAVLYGSLLLITCLRTGGDEKYLQLCILNVGVACGWLLGIMASPDDAEEQTRFSRFGTTAGTFLTGYVLSKFQFESVLTASFWTPDVAFRFLLFLGGLLVAALVAYSLREYVLPSASEVPALPIAEKHEFAVAPGGIGLLSCCSALPDAARLRLQVLASDGVLYVARTDTPVTDVQAFPKDVALNRHTTREIQAVEAGSKGQLLALHNTGKTAARVSVVVYGSTSGPTDR